MNGPKVLVLAAILLALVIPAAIASPTPHVTYTVKAIEEGTVYTFPSFPDVGNLTGLFIAHHAVEIYEAKLATDYGTLYAYYSKAEMNRNNSYDFAFYFTKFFRDSDYPARIVNITQVVVEQRASGTTTYVQMYYYNETTESYVAVPSSLLSMRYRGGNPKFFLDMALEPHENVTTTSELRIALLVPFYVVANDATNVKVTLYLTLSVKGNTYTLELQNEMPVVHTVAELRKGNEKTNVANVTVGQRVLFTLFVYNPPALAISIASEAAMLPQTTLPNPYLPVKINATYYRPVPPGAAGGFIGHGLTEQSVYNYDNSRIESIFPITLGVYKQNFHVYIFYPKAIRIYVDPTGETKTGVVRGMITLILNAVSYVQSGINAVAVAFVIIIAIIAVITIYIFLRTMRA